MVWEVGGVQDFLEVEFIFKKEIGGFRVFEDNEVIDFFFFWLCIEEVFLTVVSDIFRVKMERGKDLELRQLCFRFGFIMEIL